MKCNYEVKSGLINLEAPGFSNDNPGLHLLRLPQIKLG